MRTRTVTLPPVCVAVREQYTHADCALRAVSMATGLRYEDVAKHAPAKALATGLKVGQLHRLGKALGVRFLLTPDADLDDQETTGLCWIEFARSAHLVYIFKGVLCNPADATVWTPSEYLGHYDAEGWLYVLAPLQRRPKQGRREA